MALIPRIRREQREELTQSEDGLATCEVSNGTVALNTFSRVQCLNECAFVYHSSSGRVHDDHIVLHSVEYCRTERKGKSALKAKNDFCRFSPVQPT